jgi:hypothetical protein
MLRHILQRGLFASLLVLSLTPLVYAGESAGPAVSRGIVLTIVALDPKTDTAALQTQHGHRAFQTIAWPSWKLGHKVECDLVDEIYPGPQLQNCKPW